MNTKKNILGYHIIESAIIWGLTILGVAFKLKDTGCFGEISYILGIAAVVHLIIIWGPLTAQLKKLGESKNDK